MNHIPTGDRPSNPRQPYPTQAEFLEKLSYDPLTGEIRWREGAVRASYRNPVVLGPGDMPVIRWGTRVFQAIKVAYVMHTGDNTLITRDSVAPNDLDVLNFKGDNLTRYHNAPRFEQGKPRPPFTLIRKKHQAWVESQKSAKARRLASIIQEPRFNDPRPDSRTKARPLPPVETLHALFTYNPETGDLRWKDGPRHRNSSGRKPGTLVGTPVGLGYLKVNVESRSYFVHRIAWKMHHGEDPGTRLINHIDHDPMNNCMENLRLAKHAQNSHNSSRKPAGKSGVKGVHWIKPLKKWKAQFTTGGHLHVCGYFDTVEAAAAAVTTARNIIQGEFSPAPRVHETAPRSGGSPR